MGGGFTGLGFICLRFGRAGGLGIVGTGLVAGVLWYWFWVLVVTSGLTVVGFIGSSLGRVGGGTGVWMSGGLGWLLGLG